MCVQTVIVYGQDNICICPLPKVRTQMTQASFYRNEHLQRGIGFDLEDKQLAAELSRLKKENLSKELRAHKVIAEN